MKTAIILGLTVLSLSACNAITKDQPKIVSSNNEGSSYVFDGSYEQLTMISQRAMADCQKVGRFATLKNSGPFEDKYIANYNCISCGGY